jgi:hypothetical protein
MSLMENTMGYMMGKMSLERKQDMMLKMMPMMMKDVNMAETMLKMMPQMLDHISLLDVFNLFKKLFPHLLKGINTLSELAEKWDEIFPKLMEKIPEHMEKAMPVMEVMMPLIMGKMMPLMMTEENMDRMEQIPARMAPKMMANENLNKIIPEMMARILPHCLENCLPHLPDDRRKDFASHLNSILEASDQ